jgi:2-polyprenyl-3-methyl-5-hydroxy-6-metoxy-1,4-benzoquinol methylase
MEFLLSKLNSERLQRVLRQIRFRFFGSRDFDKMLQKLVESQVYGEFCEKVYGRNLCQLNVLDEDQLQAMLAELNITSSDRVLDLGCGVGKLSEYISFSTGAHVTGIDYAKKTVAMAKERTISQKNQLEYKIFDLNKLSTRLGSFDYVLALDTLYFVDDLEDSILAIKKILKPGGKFVTFYSCKVIGSSDYRQMDPIANDLGAALTKCGFEFKTWNFTDNQERIWRTCIEVSTELKEKFEDEGNIDIYASRLAEGQRHLKTIEKKRAARFMYLATVES